MQDSALTPPDGVVTRRTHAERVETSVRSMLDATEALILELGTKRTTLKEVGERAGYSRGLAHARFGSKEELFLKLSERCRETWRREMMQAAKGRQGLAALLSRLEASATYAARYPDDARVMYILWFESVGFPSAMRTSLSHFHQQARKDIKELVEQARSRGEIAKDVDSDDFAILFTSSMFGLSYQWIVNPDEIDISFSVARLRAQLLMILRPTASGRKVM